MSRTRRLQRATVKRRKKIITYVMVEREVVSAGPEYTAFAEVLRDLRKKAGMNQADLAREIGLSRPSVANIEAGRQRITLGDVFLFARALQVDPRKLFARVAKDLEARHGK